MSAQAAPQVPLAISVAIVVQTAALVVQAVVAVPARPVAILVVRDSLWPKMTGCVRFAHTKTNRILAYVRFALTIKMTFKTIISITIQPIQTSSQAIITRIIRIKLMVLIVRQLGCPRLVELILIAT